MHCARAARIDWIQHHACSIAGMAASFFCFPGVAENRQTE
ncbi:hypothetical protein RSPO_c02742 [Ralstonia solanacearum Po82]|uniref:Uncharacterized protein n=1 Tax=Ralstonia solanacearum (strain Po82) TaxID=1031711 RepID=F6G3Y7_RALS8|nr:hypothetical protein RSPO_c02742 [Ralstonia solanacearum Po82]